jgi:hypothetical protein
MRSTKKLPGVVALLKLTMAAIGGQLGKGHPQSRRLDRVSVGHPTDDVANPSVSV